MTTVAEAAWDRWDAKVRAEAFEQGHERGLEQGHEKGVERGVRRGGARLIGRQAALKFGTGTAERLTGLLQDLTAQEDLDRVGDWILECGSGDEMLSRVSGLLADRRGSPPPPPFLRRAVIDAASAQSDSPSGAPRRRTLMRAPSDRFLKRAKRSAASVEAEQPPKPVRRVSVKSCSTFSGQGRNLPIGALVGVFGQSA